MLKHSIVATNGSQERLAYSINDFCRAVGIGRTLTYDLIAKGELRTVTLRGRRIIPAAEVNRLLNKTGGDFEKR